MHLVVIYPGSGCKVKCAHCMHKSFLNHSLFDRLLCTGSSLCRTVAGSSLCHSVTGSLLCRSVAGSSLCRSVAGSSLCRSTAGSSLCRSAAGSSLCHSVAGSYVVTCKAVLADHEKRGSMETMETKNNEENNEETKNSDSVVDLWIHHRERLCCFIIIL